MICNTFAMKLPRHSINPRVAPYPIEMQGLSTLGGEKVRV